MRWKHSHKDRTITDLGKDSDAKTQIVNSINEPKIEFNQHVNEKKKKNSMYAYSEYYNPYMDLENMIDENFDLKTTPTMSPEAIEKIYRLYTAGWTIRDISRRFGILPARAKYYIWARAQTYH